jgi:hypothetical protein
MRDEDKNNRLCLGCEKRIIYDQQLEQELNFSKSYTDTCLYARVSYVRISRQAKNGFWLICLELPANCKLLISHKIFNPAL